VLNQAAPTNLFDFEEEEAGVVLDVTLDDFNITDTYKALKNLKNNNAAGLDEVTVELMKHGRDTVVCELTDLYNRIWRAEEVPDDWKQKHQKGCLSDCNNWRGIITLLSIPSKVFCGILLNRLKSEVDNILREKQAGFRKGRSCNERILTLRNRIIDQTLKWQLPLFINYVDFKKALDSIHQVS